MLASLVGYSFYRAVLQTDKELKTAQGSVQNLIQFYWDAEDITFPSGDRIVVDTSETNSPSEPSPSSTETPAESPVP